MVDISEHWFSNCEIHVTWYTDYFIWISFIIIIIKIFDCSRQALVNFERCVKPGGLLLIDHRNYDYIITTGQCPPKCIYYNVSTNQVYPLFLVGNI